MNFKLNANSLPRVSKEKWLSLDMHAKTIGVPCEDMHSRNDAGEKKNGAPQDAIDR